jgi:hypothetical protein
MLSISGTFPSLYDIIIKEEGEENDWRTRQKIPKAEKNISI